MRALIGEIARYALHDGPGIRSTVFFKGCNLRCPWCHNSELIAAVPQILFFPGRCMACGDCGRACPNGAIGRSENAAALNRSNCLACGECAIRCPTKAVELAGRWMTVDAMMAVLLRDRHYYQASGGGVTLSGGEATLQMDAAGLLLQRLKQHQIHTALQTNGLFDLGRFCSTCLANTDVIYLDVKYADARNHHRVTGQDNQRIWFNLEALLERVPERIIVRTPVVPGYTDSEDNLGAIQQRLELLGNRRWEKVPYHPFGIDKARFLGCEASDVRQNCSVPVG